MEVKSENERAVAGIYEELKGLFSSIRDQGSWFDDEGFTSQVNGTINRAKIVCPEIQDMDSYLLRQGYLQNRGAIVHVTEAKAKLNALIGRLKGTYGLDAPSSASGHTFVQNQSQTQLQYQTTILDLQERIIAEIPKYPEGSKERGFLEKLKSALPTIKDVMDILATALKIGAEFGLDSATVLKLLALA